MSTAVCPCCEEDISISCRVKIGSKVTCLECGTPLEVVQLDPIELDYALAEEDDQEEEWDDEESSEEQDVLTAVCPICYEEILVPGRYARSGQEISCPECDSPLKVIQLDPIELDYALAEEDDQEEEWDDEESSEEQDMPAAVCPSCDEDIAIPIRVRPGQKIMCPECGAPLEVVDVDPVELDWYFEELEDDGSEDQTRSMGWAALFPNRRGR